MDTLGYAIVDFIDVIGSAKKARRNWWELALFLSFFAALGLFIAYQVRLIYSTRQRRSVETEEGIIDHHTH